MLWNVSGIQAYRPAGIANRTRIAAECLLLILSHRACQKAAEKTSRSCKGLATAALAVWAWVRALSSQKRNPISPSPLDHWLFAGRPFSVPAKILAAPGNCGRRGSAGARAPVRLKGKRRAQMGGPCLRAARRNLRPAAMQRLDAAAPATYRAADGAAVEWERASRDDRVEVNSSVA